MKTIPISQIFHNINIERGNTELAFFFVLIQRGLNMEDVKLSEEDSAKLKEKIDDDISNDRIRSDEYSAIYVEWIKAL